MESKKLECYNLYRLLIVKGEKMMLKKISMLFLALTFALVIPSSPAFASEKDQEVSVVILPKASVSAGASIMGPGEWDYVGSSTLSYVSSGVYASGYVHSGGGDFLVCASRGNYYDLWEYDGGHSTNDYVSTKWISAGGCTPWRDIGNYVDGDNKKAEFFVAASASANVDFYD